MTQAVETRAVQLVDELNPQGLANVLWALASMQHQPGERALTTLSSRGVGRLAARFNSQNLANVVCDPYQSTDHHLPPPVLRVDLVSESPGCLDRRMFNVGWVRSNPRGWLHGRYGPMPRCGGYRIRPWWPHCSQRARSA